MVGGLPRSIFVKGKEIGWFALGSLGAGALGFVTLPLMAWFFSTEDVGRLAMLQVTVSVAVILLALGQDSAYLREYHEHKPGARGILFQRAVTPGLVLFSIGGACLVAFDQSLPSVLVFGLEEMWLGAFIVLILFLAFVIRFLALPLRMEERGIAFSASQVVPKALFLSLIVFYVTWEPYPGINGIVGAQAVALSMTVILLVWLRSRTDAVVREGEQPVRVISTGKMLSFGLPLLIGGLAYFGMIALDKVFLRVFTSFSELGVYSVAASFAAGAGLVSGIFSMLWGPTMYKWAAKGQPLDRVDRVSEDVLALVVGLFLVAGIGSSLLTTLLPPEYEMVQFLFPALLTVPLFYMLTETASVGLAIQRKPQLSMVSALAALGLNGLLNWILIPRFGVVGAAAATAISLWVFLVLRVELASRNWRRLPRFRLYVLSFGVLLGVLAYAALGPREVFTWNVIWVIGMALWIWVCRDTWRRGTRYLKAQMRANSLFKPS
jgi:O-antigen/teichoic acid export membrane protein